MRHKQPSLKRCVSSAIQNGKKLSHSNSVTFYVKKAKENVVIRLSDYTLLKQKHLLYLKNSPSGKTPETYGFEPTLKMSTHAFVMPFTSSSGSEQIHCQVDVLWNSSVKERFHWEHKCCQWSWNVKDRMNPRSWSMWRRFIGWFMEIGPLTFGLFWGAKRPSRGQLANSLSTLELTFHPHLISKSCYLCMKDLIWYNFIYIREPVLLYSQVL